MRSPAVHFPEVSMLEQNLSLPTGLDAWIASIKNKIGMRILTNLTTDTDKMDRYLECVEIQELSGTFICCSFYQSDINDALTRAGLFMGAGKGFKAGTLTAQDDFTLINYKKLVAGHNLSGGTVLKFFEAVDQQSQSLMQANPAEAAFAKSFLSSKRVAALGSQFYLVGFSIQSMKDQKAIISHEIFHAYYFLNPQYRDTIVKFWNDIVTVSDRAAITLEIGKAYNVDEEDLVIDEFQAYLIQSGADGDRMKHYVPKYRERLLDELAKNKIKFLQI